MLKAKGYSQWCTFRNDKDPLAQRPELRPATPRAVGPRVPPVMPRPPLWECCRKTSSLGRTPSRARTGTASPALFQEWWTIRSSPGDTCRLLSLNSRGSSFRMSVHCFDTRSAFERALAGNHFVENRAEAEHVQWVAPAATAWKWSVRISWRERTCRTVIPACDPLSRSFKFLPENQRQAFLQIVNEQIQ